MYASLYEASPHDILVVIDPVPPASMPALPLMNPPAPLPPPGFDPETPFAPPPGLEEPPLVEEVPAPGFPLPDTPLAPEDPLPLPPDPELLPVPFEAFGFAWPHAKLKAKAENTAWIE